MSEERQETIEDIVDDIRAQNQGLPEDRYALSPLVCDLLSIADRIEKAEKREIETLRSLVEGLIKASSVDCASCGYDCGPRRENCIIKKAIVYLEGHS